MKKSDTETGDEGNWRKALTKDERAELREIDRAIKRGDKELKTLRAARRKIQNRATKRGVYAKMKGQNPTQQ